VTFKKNTLYEENGENPLNAFIPLEREAKIVRSSLRSDRRIVFFLFRRSVAPHRAPSSLSAPLRSGPSSDCARRFTKKSAQEEESKRKSPVNREPSVSRQGQVLSKSTGSPKAHEEAPPWERKRFG
jgi:hypothetical protein